MSSRILVTGGKSPLTICSAPKMERKFWRSGASAADGSITRCGLWRRHHVTMILNR
jgi:hypothetical protein